MIGLHLLNLFIPGNKCDHGLMERPVTHHFDGVSRLGVGKNSVNPLPGQVKNLDQGPFKMLLL